MDKIDVLNQDLSCYVELSVSGAVLTITMVKPKVNAICPQMSESLYQAAMVLQNTPQLRVGILTSRWNSAFCAGLDFNRAETGFGPRCAGGFGGITQAWDLKKPLIAAINAPAIGGGLELALACDIMIMADTAWLQLPELARGLLPDGGGLQRLPRRIPYHVATAMIWTGARMSATEAVGWGLVWRTVPPQDLMSLAHTLAAQIAQGAPLAQQAFKEVMRVVDTMGERDAMALRAQDHDDLSNYSKMLTSVDMIEGQRAFLEKRAPHWRGQ